jgi:hypothetical protein
VDLRWLVVLLALVSLAGALVALVWGRTRSYRRALGCSLGWAMGTSLIGLAAALVAGVVAGMALGRALGAGAWVGVIAGWLTAVVADAASAVWLSDLRHSAHPGFTALLARVVGWWLLAAVGGAVVLYLLVLLAGWIASAISLP